MRRACLEPGGHGRLEVRLRSPHRPPHRHGVEPAQLVIEVTEHSSLGDSDQARTALRQLDEMKRLQPSLPGPEETMALSVPMTPPLKELAPELLDVLQLVHNYGTLGAVLDRADADDVVTAEAVVQLLKRDYVRKA